MNVSEFVAKWEKTSLTERSASHEHFLDLCELLGHPKPAADDPTGETFTFEKGATKHSGGDGWADVWKKGFFGWEYKGKHKDLDAAYDQLLQYREDLQNPPLLVVCDMDRIVIHTNFTSTAPQLHEIKLADLSKPDNLKLLRNVFFDPEKLRPGATIQSITTEAARQLAEIAQSMRKRDLPALDVAHFLDRMIFCLFSEDVDLLPKGLFSRVLRNAQGDPARLKKLLGQLFDAMAHGGDFGAERIRHFNGNLFSDAAVLDMEAAEIEKIAAISTLDWSAVDPSIFGTLFERGLDPDKRSQLGAHYTSRADIEVLVRPVVIDPLRREWDKVRLIADNLLATGRKNPPAPPVVSPSGVAQPPPAGQEFAQAGAPVPHAKPMSAAVKAKARLQAKVLVGQFLQERLPSIRVLDPACGSGNFLYVTLQLLKNLEKEIILYANKNGLGSFIPYVGPWQLYGIEINPYAYELAQMTVWIGYLQWLRDNGLGNVTDPILRKLDTFKCMDAILDLTDPEHPKEPEWPKVDFIVGNPPFLGNRFMLGHLRKDYCKSLYALYEERLGGKPDLCCYWFERARHHIAEGKCKRAGLLATQGIRGGTNRHVLKRIQDSGGIFFAISDREWILDGANVHISIIGFDDGIEQLKLLDQRQVTAINTNLTSAADTTTARPLSENVGIAFQGAIKRGSFDVPEAEALNFVAVAGNPNGLPNSDVLLPYVNAVDLTRRTSCTWIIDFGLDSPLESAARYSAPFEHVRTTVKPEREATGDKEACEKWWIHWRTRMDMKTALANVTRFIATPRVSKHRLFVWMKAPAYPDCAIVVFARSDDYFFGVLHSRVHEVWARAQGTQLRERESGFRYTPTTCFETFPLPHPEDSQPRAAAPHWQAAISEAAKELDALRNNWLNPPEWTKEEVLEFPGSVNGPWARYIAPCEGSLSPSQGAARIGTVRYPRMVPKDDASAKLLAKRTLTNLYNQRPDWLTLAHRKLDEAAFAAYGWPVTLTDEEILERLLGLNHERAGASVP